MALIHKVTVKRHCVPVLEGGISPMQKEIMDSRSLINIVSAPTGAGKSYAFRKSVMKGERVLFIVSTKRLGQNQHESMIADLIDPIIAAREGREPWDEVVARAKVQNWNSDLLEEVKDKGYQRLRDYYVSKLDALDLVNDGGEIIFITPETLSGIFLHPSKDGKSGDVGPSAIVNWFDKIVYDEFHTIDERGFGLVTTLAMTAKQWAEIDQVQRKASIFLLSATPIKVSNVLKGFGFDVDDPDEVRYIQEQISDEGRALHGDVTVEFHEGHTPASFIPSCPDMLDVSAKEKAVIIYDSIKNLMVERPLIEAAYGDQSFLFDSGLHSQIETEMTGRSISLDAKNVIVGTSSIEMGVTIPNAVKMTTDTGFSPLSLLQRLGRISRGDVNGTAYVVFKGLGPYPWLNDIIIALKAHGDTISVQDFSVAFSSAAARLKDIETVDDSDISSTSSIVNFGSIGTRARACAALYHMLLHLRMNKFGNKRYADRFNEVFRGKMGGFYDAFNQVARLPYGKKWLGYFMAEAENLRNFAPTIPMITEKGATVTYSTYWVKKNTNIFEKYDLEFDDKGNPFVRIHSSDLSEVVEKQGYSTQKRIVMMPDGQSDIISINNAVYEYIEKLNSLTKKPNCIKGYAAVKSLILRTGILPYGEEDGKAEAITAII